MTKFVLIIISEMIIALRADSIYAFFIQIYALVKYCNTLFSTI